MNFDKYDNFYQGQFTIQHFYVKSMKLYELGKVITSNSDYNKCVLFPIEYGGVEKYTFRFENSIDNSLLKSNTTFDKGIAYADRISYCTLPVTTSSKTMGIQALKNILGPTVNKKDFDYNEPYCMNIFSVDRNVMRMSFAFGDPDRVLEFDIDYFANRTQSFNKTEAISYLLYQVKDRNDTIIMEDIPKIIPKITEGGYLSLDEVKSAIWTINSIYTNSVEVIPENDYRTTVKVHASTDEMLKIAKELSL